MLLAGDDRLVVYRRYAYPPGKLVEVDAKRRADCPACRGAELDTTEEIRDANMAQASSTSWFRRCLQRLLAPVRRR
jgi:hypothetical protein